MLDKKITTIFIITSIVIAGTALAAVLTTNTTTKTLLFGSNPVLSTTSTTTTVSDAKPVQTEVAVTTVKEADLLASIILRILGLQVSVDEITTFKSRNIGNGEITLAYNLAHASGKSVHEILHMRYDQKMGWGKIAKVLGVKLHDAADNSVLILREANLNDDAEQFKISIQVDLDDDDKDRRPNNNEEKSNRSNNADNGQHKPEKEDDHKKPHKEQEKDHGKN